jgi:hypothetical protein
MSLLAWGSSAARKALCSSWSSLTAGTAFSWLSCCTTVRHTSYSSDTWLRSASFRGRRVRMSSTVLRSLCSGVSANCGGTLRRMSQNGAKKAPSQPGYSGVSTISMPSLSSRATLSLSSTAARAGEGEDQRVRVREGGQGRKGGRPGRRPSPAPHSWPCWSAAGMSPRTAWRRRLRESRGLTRPIPASAHACWARSASHAAAGRLRKAWAQRCMVPEARDPLAELCGPWPSLSPLELHIRLGRSPITTDLLSTHQDDVAGEGLLTAAAH